MARGCVASLLWAYKWDWLCCLVGSLVGGLPQRLVRPAKQQWVPLDTAFMHPPFKGSQLPMLTLFAITIAIPLALLLLCHWLRPLVRGGPRIPRELHHALLGWTFAFCLFLLLQGLPSIVKGGLRPDWYHRCRPPDYPTPESLLAWPVGSHVACSPSAKGEDLTNGRRSFPCGHCNLSAASLGFLAWYLAGLLHIFDGKAHLWKHMCFVIPLLGALLISLTRSTEARHHGFDILAGMVFGLGAATYAYMNLFHFPWGERCGLPRTSRDTLGMPEEYVEACQQQPQQQPQRQHSVFFARSGSDSTHEELQTAPC